MGCSQLARAWLIPRIEIQRAAGTFARFQHNRNIIWISDCFPTVELCLQFDPDPRLCEQLSRRRSAALERFPETIGDGSKVRQSRSLCPVQFAEFWGRNRRPRPFRNRRPGHSTGVGRRLADRFDKARSDGHIMAKAGVPGQNRNMSDAAKIRTADRNGALKSHAACKLPPASARSMKIGRIVKVPRLPTSHLARFCELEDRNRCRLLCQTPLPKSNSATAMACGHI